MSSSSDKKAEQLQKRLVQYYEEVCVAPDELYSEHFHHGFYEPGSTVSLLDSHSAQVRMIEEVLRFASISDEAMKRPKKIVDVGCGFGGASRYLARKYGAECKGIAISSGEVQRAIALTTAQGLENKVSFEVADALAMPFPDEQFDLVWSMQSAEHMEDKQKLVRELARVAAPGATIILVTWCHRDLSPSELSLKRKEKTFMNMLCEEMVSPPWCSAADYVKMFESSSLKDIKNEDWSQYVNPFWPAVRRSLLSWSGIKLLSTGGWKPIKEFMLMSHMIEAEKMGLSKFAAMTCRKPE